MDTKVEKISATLALILIPCGIALYSIGHSIAGIIASLLGCLSLLSYIVTVMLDRDLRERWATGMRESATSIRRLRLRSPLFLNRRDGDAEPPHESIRPKAALPNPESIEQLRTIHRLASIAFQHVAELLSAEASELRASTSRMSSCLGRLLQHSLLPEFEAARLRLQELLLSSATVDLKKCLVAFEDASDKYASAASYWIWIQLEKLGEGVYSTNDYAGLTRRHQELRQALARVRGRNDLGKLLSHHPFFQSPLPEPAPLKLDAEFRSWFDIAKGWKNLSSHQIVSISASNSQCLTAIVQNESGRHLVLVASLTDPKKRVQSKAVWLESKSNKIAFSYGEQGTLILALSWPTDDWQYEWHLVEELDLDNQGQARGRTIGKEAELYLRLTADEIEQTYRCRLTFERGETGAQPIPRFAIVREHDVPLALKLAP